MGKSVKKLQIGVESENNIGPLIAARMSATVEGEHIIVFPR